MTADAREDAVAASAQAAGEAAEARHLAEAQAQHQASGSAVVVEQASTPDDVAVSWSNTDNAASPSLSPSTPRPVNSFERDAADPT
jgi:hypothetical protein